MDLCHTNASTNGRTVLVSRRLGALTKKTNLFSLTPNKKTKELIEGICMRKSNSVFASIDFLANQRYNDVAIFDI